MDDFPGGLDSIVEDNFNVSMWMFSPDRTAEELEEFALTGAIPVERRYERRKGLTQKEPIKVDANIDFPSYPLNGDKFLDRKTGGYYEWTGSRWRKIANTPAPKTNVSVSFVKERLTVDQLDKLRLLVMGKVAELKIPEFTSKIEEKRWCADTLSVPLDCKISIEEDQDLGRVIIEIEGSRKVMEHGIVNWRWHDKSIQDFKDHLFNMWSLSASPDEKRRVFFTLLGEKIEADLRRQQKRLQVVSDER